MSGALRFGYKAAAEQFGPKALLAYCQEAEKAGFDSVFVSDHFHPFWNADGHAPAVPAWLGAATQRTGRIMLGTSVLAPTFRQHPAVVAQNFATLACLAPGRIVLGIGSGEPINELPFGLEEWPGFGERFERLQEATAIIQALWTGDFVDFDGRHFRLRGARLYDLPPRPPPLYIAASGEKVARYAGAQADGLIATSAHGSDHCRDRLFGPASAAAASADRSGFERVLEVKVSYDRNRERAVAQTKTWAALDFLREKTGDPRRLEALADAPPTGPGRWLVASDPDEHVEQLQPFLKLATHVVFHSPSDEQPAFIRRYGREVLPRLRMLI